MAFSTSFWGGRQTSADYQMLMEGDNALARLVDLTGHGMTSFGQELTDPVDVNEVILERGRIVNRSVRVRSAEQTAVTFSLLMGNQLWSRLLHHARTAGGSCHTALFGRRLCPKEPTLEHMYIWKDVAIDPPTRANDFIVIDGSTTVAEWQADARASRELVLYHTQGSVLSDTTPPLRAITFVPEVCAECASSAVHQKFFAVGGTGTGSDPVIVYRTNNRFSSITTLSTPAPTGSVATSVYAEGNAVLIGFADDPDIATASTGGTIFSTNNGDSFTIDTGITEPVWGVTYFNDRYIAIGGTGTGAALIWTSLDGITWSAITSPALPGTHALRSVDVDRESQVMWVVGEGGTLLRVTGAGTNLVVLNKSASLPGTPGLLNVVRVLDKDRIVVAGASGYYAESLDGGNTWYEPNVPGSAAILAAGGTAFRSFVGAGSQFYIRDGLTDNQYTTKPLAFGSAITGTITGIARPTDSEQDGMNYFAAVTDAGEIVLFTPPYPGA